MTTPAQPKTVTIWVVHVSPAYQLRRSQATNDNHCTFSVRQVPRSPLAIPISGALHGHLSGWFNWHNIRTACGKTLAGTDCLNVTPVGQTMRNDPLNDFPSFSHSSVYAGPFSLRSRVEVLPMEGITVTTEQQPQHVVDVAAPDLPDQTPNDFLSLDTQGLQTLVFLYFDHSGHRDTMSIWTRPTPTGANDVRAICVATAFDHTSPLHVRYIQDSNNEFSTARFLSDAYAPFEKATGARLESFQLRTFSVLPLPHTHPLEATPAPPAPPALRIPAENLTLQPILHQAGYTGPTRYRVGVVHLVEQQITLLYDSETTPFQRHVYHVDDHWWINERSPDKCESACGTSFIATWNDLNEKIGVHRLLDFATSAYPLGQVPRRHTHDPHSPAPIVGRVLAESSV
ncbi:hypothetical protein TWF281_010473 [Arthrobotrys megalospora]